jgi:hypothetical protein
MNKDRNLDKAEFLDKYIEQKKFGTKFWMWITVIVIIVVLMFLLKKDIFSTGITPKELSNSITFFDIHSQWMVKEKDKEDKTEGTILVPQSIFRITNAGTKNLENVQIIGVFTFLDIANVRGEGFAYLEKNILKPGESTKSIVITSDRGYRASSRKAFKNNKNWKRAFVKLFARSSGGGIALLDTFYISRKIEGENIEIKLRSTPDTSENNEKQ